MCSRRSSPGDPTSVLELVIGRCLGPQHEANCPHAVCPRGSPRTADALLSVSRGGEPRPGQWNSFGGARVSYENEAGSGLGRRWLSGTTPTKWQMPSHLGLIEETIELGNIR